jgi:hypothetical protein
MLIHGTHIPDYGAVQTMYVIAVRMVCTYIFYVHKLCTDIFMDALSVMMRWYM